MLNRADARTSERHEARGLGAADALRRAFDFGAAATSAAALRLASSDESEERARTRLLMRLRKMHGLPHKIAQLMALGDVAEETAALPQEPSATPPLSLLRVREILREELGERVFFRLVGLESSATPASIGQVHRGLLNDGTRVAVKVQYPGVRDGIETDLGAVGWLARPFGDLRRDFSLDAYRAELREMLLAETDYTIEAESLRRFGQRVAQWDGVVVPQPVDGMCSARVLTMTWVEGDPVGVCRNWPRHERAYAAQQLLRFFLSCLLDWREIYADAHPGNFRFQRTNGDPVLGILDFGCLRTIDGGTGEALSRIIDAVARGGLDEYFDADFVEMYAAAGFDYDRIEPMKARLRALSALLFEPFAAAAPFDPAEWKLGERAAVILGDDRLSFRTAGPPALLAFIRAYYGLIQHLRALDAPVSWREVYAKVRRETAPVARVEIAPRVASPVSTHLRIRVEEHGRLKADLTMRGHLAGELQDLVPESVLETVARRGIDLEALSQRAAESGFTAQRLFDADEGPKTVRVWLE